MYHISEPPQKALIINIGYYFSYRQTSITNYGAVKDEISLDIFQRGFVGCLHCVCPTEEIGNRNVEAVNS